jgi:macrolide transport system ATP-binding/permease protein
MLNDLRFRLRALFRSKTMDDEAREEWEFHLHHEARKHHERGVLPGIALRKARVYLGSVDQTVQQCREARGTKLVMDILQDVRFAARQLRKRPLFALIAVAVFTLGIAACTAAFALVDAVLVKPLPYSHPSRLVSLFERLPIGNRYHLSYFDYQDWKRRNHVFSSLDVFRPERFTIATPSGEDAVPGAVVSAGFFRTLGVAPVLGRNFRTGEDRIGAPSTVILSYGTWQSRFGASKGILGTTVNLDGDLSIVIGVLPRGFYFPPAGPAGYWKTIHGFCADLRTCYPYYGIARLKDGVSVQTAATDLTAIAHQIAVSFPLSNRDRSAYVLPLTDAILGSIRPTLLTLLTGAAALALIGFMNVTGLLLVRAEARRREIAVRKALGASRNRLLRQFAVEGFLVAGFGGLLGLALATLSIKSIASLVPTEFLDSMPYLQGIHTNWHVVGAALVLSLLGGSLFTLGPALQLFRVNMQQGLAAGGRSVTSGSWRRLGAGLVIAELAMTAMLLTSGGLLAKSFYRLLHKDIGISADHLAVLHVLGPDNSTNAEQIAWEQQIRSQVSTLPGVESVGVSEELAVAGGESYKMHFAHFHVLGKASPGIGDEAADEGASVGYFETLRASLMKGRFFQETDDAGRSRVAVINQTMAMQEFPGEDPIGKFLVDQYDEKHPIEVIGVVGDIQDGPLDSKPTAAVYSPFNQFPNSEFYMTIRTTTAAGAILPSVMHRLHRTEPGLLTDGEVTMTARIDTSPSAYLHRSAACVVVSFAGIALLLGTVGLYGVISFSVEQRTREIGIRMALGAQRSSVYALILKEAGVVLAAGLVAGLLSSAAAAMLLRSMLYGVRPWDIEIAAGVFVTLSVAALLASYLPARRAASVEPTLALRAE